MELFSRLVNSIVAVLFQFFKTSSPTRPMPPPPPIPAGVPPTPAPTPTPILPPPIPTQLPLGSRLSSFYAFYDHKFVNIDNNQFGAQCVELCNAWCDWIGIERFPGNAADFQFDSHPDCSWTPNGPLNVPSPGSVVVWRKSPTLPFGHCGVMLHGDSMKLTTDDQNWPFNSPAHAQDHSYVGVAGWLTPLHWK